MKTCWVCNSRSVTQEFSGGKKMNGVVKNIAIIKVGLPVTANKRAEQFNLTDDKKYTVIGYDGECILIENDLGNKEYYSKEYFYEYEDLYI